MAFNNTISFPSYIRVSFKALLLQPCDHSAEKNQPVYITAVSASVDILLQGLPSIMGFSNVLKELEDCLLKPLLTRDGDDGIPVSAAK